MSVSCFPVIASGTTTSVVSLSVRELREVRTALICAYTANDAWSDVPGVESFCAWEVKMLQQQQIKVLSTLHTVGVTVPSFRYCGNVWLEPVRSSEQRIVGFHY